MNPAGNAAVSSTSKGGASVVAATGQRCNPVACLKYRTRLETALSSRLSIEAGPALPLGFTAGFDFGPQAHRGFHIEPGWNENLVSRLARTSNLAGIKNLVAGSAPNIEPGWNPTSHPVGTNIEPGCKKPRTQIAGRSNLAGTTLSSLDGTLIEPGWKKHRTQTEQIYT